MTFKFSETIWRAKNYTSMKLDNFLGFLLVLILNYTFWSYSSSLLLFILFFPWTLPCSRRTLFDSHDVLPTMIPRFTSHFTPSFVTLLACTHFSQDKTVCRVYPELSLVYSLSSEESMSRWEHKIFQSLLCASTLRMSVFHSFSFASFSFLKLTIWSCRSTSTIPVITCTAWRNSDVTSGLLEYWWTPSCLLLTTPVHGWTLVYMLFTTGRIIENQTGAEAKWGGKLYRFFEFLGCNPLNGCHLVVMNETIVLWRQLILNVYEGHFLRHCWKLHFCI